MGRFTDRVVLVTGGSSGIGLACARQFASEGARVIITGRNAEALSQVKTALGEHAEAIRSDVSKTGDLDALFAKIKQMHGRLDVVHANAGIVKLAPVQDTTEALFDEMMGINLRGSYFTVQKSLPLLADGGAIVFTTSWFDAVGVAGTSVVSATKAALRSLTRTLAAELVGRKIRVNAVSPGSIETPLYGKLGMAEKAVQDLGAELVRQIPAGRFGAPEEIAKTVAFLASDDASYITGVELAVDGGRTQL